MVKTIIPNNRSLDATPYSMFHLPALVPGTDGMALPKENTTAVLCVAPGNATTWNENWGQELDLHPGDPHLALTASDTYPNQIFHRDYVIKEAVSPDHPLAVVLREFWEECGFTLDDLRRAWQSYLVRFKTQPPKWLDVIRSQLAADDSVFFLARKEQPVLLRGVVDLRFMTSEGPTRLEHGAVLVAHPEDPTNQWLMRAEKFADRYDWVRSPASGLLIPNAD